MGQLFRLLIVLIGVGMILLVVRQALASRKQHRKPPQITAAMVQCAHCGVHLPESDALRGGDATYCSETHRKAGPAV